ncbi:MAG: ABC transporter substrate-binding protein [Ignisphaera sp.]
MQLRIVSLSPAVTETLVLLGLEDEIVGVTPWCRMYLNNPVRKEIAGTYLHVPIKKLRDLNPDIVFLQSRVHDRIFNDVKSAGFNAYLMPLPTNVSAIISHIVLDVGSIVGRYYKSRRLVEELLAKVVEIYSRFVGGRRPRVYVEYLWPDKTYSTGGALTFIDDGIWIAGGENIFHNTPKEFFNPRDEDIVAKNPDLILVNIEPPWESLTVDKYKEIRLPLSGSDAFKYNRILLVKETRDVNLAHFGPSFISTIDWLSKTLRQYLR